MAENDLTGGVLGAIAAGHRTNRAIQVYVLGRVAYGGYDRGIDATIQKLRKRGEIVLRDRQWFAAGGEPSQPVGKEKGRADLRVRCEVIRGVEGLALYVNGTRVAGPKPWGGGDPVVVWFIDPDELRAALEAVCECGAGGGDAWKCAKRKKLDRVACPCRCHRYLETRK